MTRLIGIDAFREELRASGEPKNAVFRVQSGSPIAVDDGARKIRWCFSDGTVDRMGDTIDPNGWDLVSFMRNPVALWAHDSSQPPIGRASNVTVDGGKLMGDIEFAPAQTYAFADTIYRLARDGYISAVSVGFKPIEFKWANEDEREWGIDFQRQELLEISVVPVPANANALIDARAKGIDLRSLEKWAMAVLKDADKPRLSRRRRAAADWRCGAARDLGIDDSGEWDGQVAEDSIFSWAGGDDFDPEKAKRGFLLYNAADDKLRGSYKLPFARVVGGELKAVEEGIRAAASRLHQTDAPQNELDRADGVIKHYEERMGIGEDADKHAAPPHRKDGGMGESDPASGGALVANCGRARDEECGLKDPAECSIHGVDSMDEKALADTIARAVRLGVQSALRTAGVAPVTRDPEDGDGKEPSMDGDVRRMVRMAHEHLKAADDFYDAGDDHHDKALDLLEEAHKAIDAEHDDKPEDGGRGDDKPADDETRARIAAARRMRRELNS